MTTCMTPALCANAAWNICPDAGLPPLVILTVNEWSDPVAESPVGDVPAPASAAGDGVPPSLVRMWCRLNAVKFWTAWRRPKLTVTPVAVEADGPLAMAAVALVPRSVHTAVPSVTVPPPVGHVGWLLPDVPAVVHWYRGLLPGVGRA